MPCGVHESERKTVHLFSYCELSQIVNRRYKLYKQRVSSPVFYPMIVRLEYIVSQDGGSVARSTDGPGKHRDKRSLFRYPTFCNRASFLLGEELFAFKGGRINSRRLLVGLPDLP